MTAAAGAANRPRRSWRQWAGLTLALAVVILTVLVASYTVHDVVPGRYGWWTVVVFLVGLESVYLLTVAALSVAVPVLAVSCVRAGRGASRTRAARKLLLCASVGLSLAAGEIGSAVAARLGRPEAAPEGPSSYSRLRLPLPAESVKYPDSFRETAPPNEYTVAIFGESSAEGVPYNYWVSPGRLVVWELERLFPGRSFNLITRAVSGSNLEAQHEALAALERRPDVVIIYCGHNEFSARMPFSREVAYYPDGRPPSAGERLLAAAERLSPLCAAMRRAADRARVGIPPPRHGHRFLVDVPCYTAAEYEFLRSNFSRRLDAMVAYAQKLGALPVLILPPANDSGFDPNRTFLAPATLGPARAAVEAELRAVRRLEPSDPDAARLRYERLLADQPVCAEAHYRLSRLHQDAGRLDEAYRHAVAARDQDGFPMRCPSDFQQAYRDVAARRRCPLIDGQAYFRSISPTGLLDDTLFHDGMHPSLRGQLALAQGVLQALKGSKAFGWPDDRPVPVIDPKEAVRRGGLGAYEWGRVCFFGAIFYDLTASMREDQSARLARRRAYFEAGRAVEKGKAPDTVGLPGIGVPAPVPLSPAAVTWPSPGPGRPGPAGAAASDGSRGG